MATGDTTAETDPASRQGIEMTPAYVRPLTPIETAEMLVNGWTCAKCREPAAERVVGPGAFRLCQQHADEVRLRLEAMNG